MRTAFGSHPRFELNDIGFELEVISKAPNHAKRKDTRA